MRGTLERIHLVSDHGRAYVVGGWPAETVFSSAAAHLHLKPGTEDLVDLKLANGRAIYRIHSFDPAHGGVYRASLEYSEIHDGG